MNRLDAQKIKKIPTQPRTSTIVCVTNQYECERLIKAGRVVADLSNTDLRVINVSPVDISRTDFAALEYLYEVSKQYEASMSILYSDDAYHTLASYLKQNKASHVVTGESDGKNTMLPHLWSRFSMTRFFTVSKNGQLQEVVTAPTAAMA